jgi:acyl-CoA dehydrogenase
MNFALDDGQRLLINTVRSFIAKELKPLENEVETTGVLRPESARAIHDKAKALGLYALNIPEEHGGGGLSALDHMLLEEQFGHTTDIPVRRAFGNVYEMLLECRGAQIERWLRPCVTGERVCSIAFTEPDAGSDAAGVKTRAVRDGDGWKLSGQKHFISDGLVSDFFLTTAVTDPSLGPRGISIFLVDKGLPGFTIGNRWLCWAKRAAACGWRYRRSAACAWRRSVRAPSARPSTCSTSRSPMPPGASNSASRLAISRWCSR